MGLKTLNTDLCLCRDESYIRDVHGTRERQQAATLKFTPDRSGPRSLMHVDLH